MMLTPGPVPLRHISTPAKVVEVLRTLCGLDVPDALLKVPDALEKAWDIYGPPACSTPCAAGVLHGPAGLVR
jgi:hypothetical protein